MTQGAQRGHVVGGRYRLDKTLYTGGFGRVWQAHDQLEHDDVAVKEVWLPPAVSDAERQERLIRAEREARNAAQLRNHPNIVTVRDVVTADGIPWIVMQLVQGHSLAQDIAASGPLSANQVMYVADGLLKALGAAHQAGIVHRDVKPANVMFTDSGDVLLTDFGIAVQAADTTLTATGMLIGSMDYIAPERVRGKDNSSASDMFSLGVTLYQAATGVSPFHRDTVAASLAAILFEDPAPPKCQDGLAKFIMRLLAKDPRVRPTVPVARAMLATLSVRAEPAPPAAAAMPAGPKPTLKEPAPPRPAPTKVAAAPGRVKVRHRPKPTPVQANDSARAVPPPVRRKERARSTPTPVRRKERAPAEPKPVRRKDSAGAVPPPVRVKERARSAPPPIQFQPPKPAAVRPYARPRPATRGFAQQPQWRRGRRRGSGFAIAVVIVLGFVGAYTAWGRDAANATAGDCVYRHQQNWHLEPCSLPAPWRDTANYKVLQRIEAPPAACAATPGWSFGDNAAVVRGEPPVTLCLIPVH